VDSTKENVCSTQVSNTVVNSCVSDSTPCYSTTIASLVDKTRYCSIVRIYFLPRNNRGAFAEPLAGADDSSEAEVLGERCT